MNEKFNYIIATLPQFVIDIPSIMMEIFFSSAPLSISYFKRRMINRVSRLLPSLLLLGQLSVAFL